MVPTHPQGLTRKQSWGCTSTLSSVYTWNKWRVCQLPSLTHTAHRHPSAYPLPYKDPDIQWMLQPVSWSHIL